MAARTEGNPPRGTAYSLVKMLEAQVVASDSTMDMVGEQRERNHRYYALQPLGNELRGRSHYISPDVIDSVEGKKALFSEVFLSGRQTVKFDSGRGISKDGADAVMSYVDELLEKNHIAELLRDGWHDAFVAKRMVVHIGWNEQRTRETVIEVDGLTLDQIAQSIDRIDNILSVDTSGASQNEFGELTGDIIVRCSDYMAEMELMQPERYYRDPTVPYVREAMFAGDQKSLARAQMIRLGYDPEQVMSLAREYRWQRSEEEYARKAHDRTQATVRMHHRDELHENIDRFRVYTWLTGWDILQAAPEGEVDEWAESIGIREGEEDVLHLFEIHWSNGEVLRWADGSPCVRRAQEIPYFEWTEFKVSHAEMGLADADLTAHMQKVSSVLMRLGIDNQQMRNTSRLEARKGDVVNPRDVLDMRIGGVVWSRTGEAVRALQTPELSPFTMQILQRLDMDKDRRSGQSSLGRGMNNDALRYQNAEDMVERLTTAGNRRVMRGARDFAETMLIPMCQYLVVLAARHDHQVHELEVRGQQQKYRPSDVFPHEPMTMRAHAALTPDETSRYAQSLFLYYQVVSQDPDMKVIFGVEQKHAVWDEFLDALGVTDSSPFLISPTSPQAQQRMQAIRQQNQAQQEQAAAMQAFVQQIAQSQEGREWLKARTDAMLMQIKGVDMGADNDREDRRLTMEERHGAAKLLIDERGVAVKERAA